MAAEAHARADSNASAPRPSGRAAPNPTPRRRFGKVRYDTLRLPHKVTAREADGSVRFGAGEGSAYLFDPDIYTDGRISVQGIDAVLFPPADDAGKRPAAAAPARKPPAVTGDTRPRASFPQPRTSADSPGPVLAAGHKRPPDPSRWEESPWPVDQRRSSGRQPRRALERAATGDRRRRAGEEEVEGTRTVAEARAVTESRDEGGDSSMPPALQGAAPSLKRAGPKRNEAFRRFSRAMRESVFWPMRAGLASGPGNANTGVAPRERSRAVRPPSQTRP